MLETERLSWREGEGMLAAVQGREDRKQLRGAETGEEASRTPSPARAGRAHLAAGASSPSRCGPSPRPRALSCRQSSCHLHACKRLQQMRGRGGGGVPRGSSSQETARSVASPPPRQHTYTSAHTHARTQAHQTARQLTARQPSPNLGGSCSISPPASSSTPPKQLLGGPAHSQPPC